MMTRCSVSGALSGFVGAATWFACTAAIAAEAVVVEGFVVDVHGDPVKQAKILLIPESKDERTRLARTDQSGHYKIEKPPGGSFDIYYAHSRTGQVVVSKLSGERRQEISKILFADKDIENLPVDVVLNALNTYEYLAFMARPQKERVVSQLREHKMLPALNVLRKMAADVQDDDPRKPLLESKAQWLAGTFGPLE